MNSLFTSISFLWQFFELAMIPSLVGAGDEGEGVWRRLLQPTPRRPFAHGAPYQARHDMATFGGRCRFYYDVMSPDQMLVGAADVAAARAFLEDARRGATAPSSEAL